ncbi:sigma-54-dependent Fis family transcriptional regulator [Paraburkholderia ferrariae]|jgi:transcriptional regulator of acetoin/glycerol metabolism|uniref:sigma-54-dependent Fis family transcriptional regulator n=1 Tax=Paraburkholderia ferrariae TaxID=386056 RepID=UPI000489C8AF|nr:sigma-54-dependent Fis family transcriptional regulator [Paraburkholderia ferrariae]
MPSPSSELFSDPGDEAGVMQAWESFVRGDAVPEPALSLRALVDFSWQRCQAARVDPNQRSGPQPLPDQDLYMLRERRRELLEASAPVMACARDFLSETGTMMVLADSYSTILSVEGDTPTVGSAETIALMPGVRWSEALCGTNAIGTALAVGEPVQIHSAEHYCAGIKRWTCSASVVRHPMDGEVIGAVDVSGLSQTYNRQSLALVVTTARRIESRLSMGEMERRNALLEHSLDYWNRAHAQGLVLFDRRGNLVRLNETAHAALARLAAQGAAVEAADLRQIPQLAAGRLQASVAAHALPAWLRPEWLEPLMVAGEHIGTLVVLPCPPRAHELRAGGAEPSARARPDFANIVTGDTAMRAAIARARQLARSRVPILLLGETGVGKEEFARGIHEAGEGPYIALNCGSMARELLASELFGYADGAFTGARKGGMTGKIEAANGGVLFLDEIGEMPLDMQPHLLRVLEQGEIYRLGENVPRKVNFRLIAATHRDLRAEVAAGRFRMDLYYRVAVSTVPIPPLRERRGDIALIARHFLQRLAPGATPQGLTRAALDALHAYDWPGNVRELRNAVESALLLSEGGPIEVEHLPYELRDASAAGAGTVFKAGASAQLVREPLRGEAATATMPSHVTSIAEGEEALIRSAIAASGGNLTRAARQLNIAKSTLYVKMQRYGLRRP